MSFATDFSDRLAVDSGFDTERIKDAFERLGPIGIAQLLGPEMAAIVANACDGASHEYPWHKYEPYNETDLVCGIWDLEDQEDQYWSSWCETPFEEDVQEMFYLMDAMFAQAAQVLQPVCVPVAAPVATCSVDGCDKPRGPSGDLCQSCLWQKPCAYESPDGSRCKNGNCRFVHVYQCASPGCSRDRGGNGDMCPYHHRARTPCQYGSMCTRRGCGYMHPEGYEDYDSRKEARANAEFLKDVQRAFVKGEERLGRRAARTARRN